MMQAAEINFAIWSKMNPKYIQLYCPISTSITDNWDIPEAESFEAVLSDETELYDIPKRNEQERLLKTSLFLNDNILYLCEYIPRNWHKEYFDTRSENLVLNFKSRDNYAIEKVAKIIENIIPDNYALVAVPPGTVENNGNTAVHMLIQKIVEDVGEQKNIIDASDIIFRKIDKNRAHLSSNSQDRSLKVHYHTMGINEQVIDKIVDRPILVLDDVTTSGSSFQAMKGFLSGYNSKNITYFAIGKTINAINPEEIKVGFVLYLDGVLFKTDSGAIKEARDNKKWGDATRMAEFEANINDKAEALVMKINNMRADCCIITDANRGYAQTLLKKSRILRKEKLITNIPSHDIKGLMQAKQLMKIYDPLMIVIAKSNEDIELAHELDLITIQIGNEKSDYANYHFNSLADLINHFSDIFTILFERLVKITENHSFVIDNSPLSIEKAMEYSTGYNYFGSIEKDFLKNKERYYNEKNNLSDYF